MSRCTAPVNQSEKENGMKLTPFTFAQRCGIRISLSHESCDRSVCERSAQALQITLKVLTIELQNASRTPTSRRGNLLKASQQLTARPPLGRLFLVAEMSKNALFKIKLIIGSSTREDGSLVLADRSFSPFVVRRRQQSQNEATMPGRRPEIAVHSNKATKPKRGGNDGRRSRGESRTFE